MRRFAAEYLATMVLAGAAACLGCGEKAPPAAETETGADADADVDVMATDIERNLANLSAEDRALAEKQKVCPVTDEPLGSMGAPIKIERDGKALFICCEGCQKKAEANFDEYVAEFAGAEDDVQDETVDAADAGADAAGAADDEAK